MRSDQNSYRVEEEAVAGGVVYLLRDEEAQTEARIAPGIGNNLFSFVARPAGHPLEVMLAPDSLSQLSQFPIGFGIPVLFPFPDLVRNAEYEFEGRIYHLERRPHSRHASHAFAFDRPWSVIEHNTGQGATLRSAFRWQDHSDIQAQYPFPFELVVTYTLRGNVLQVQGEVTNLGQSRMPMGFGLHPYFRLPLSERGRREDCLVRTPTTHKWEVDEELLPTGRIVIPPPEKDFSRLRPLGRQAVDDVYTGVQFRDGWSESVLVDPSVGVEVAMRADNRFREIVIYAPPDRPTIALEPYTHTTDAIHLQAQSIDAGLIVLEPAARWTGKVEIVVRQIRSL